MSDSVWPHRQQSTRLPCPWDSSGKNTGVGCYFLLQCMKVKSEREVAQSCPTLSNPMDLSLPGSSVHGIFQARVLEWGAIAFSGFRYTDTHLIFGNAITKVRDSMAALGVYFWMELPPHSQLGVGGDLQWGKGQTPTTLQSHPPPSPKTS